MAKESMKAREVKRAKMCARYAAKRKALKEAGDYIGLQKLPKNSSPVRAHNRCKITGRPKGYICLLYTSPSPRDRQKSRMPSSA